MKQKKIIIFLYAVLGIAITLVLIFTYLVPEKPEQKNVTTQIRVPKDFNPRTSIADIPNKPLKQIILENPLPVLSRIPIHPRYYEDYQVNYVPENSNLAKAFYIENRWDFACNNNSYYFGIIRASHAEEDAIKREETQRRQKEYLE